MKLTDFLSIYGAGLSTAVAVSNYLRAKPQIRVFITPALDHVEGELEWGIGISIQNVSTQRVHITHVSLLYPFRRSNFWDKLKYAAKFKRIPNKSGWCSSSLSLYGVEHRCPASIEPGNSHYIFVRSAVMEEMLGRAISRQIKSVVQDALWRNFYSKVLEYPIQQEAREI